MARKVLLADDSVTAQNMGRKILADAGYEVITVNNGSAALKKIAETKPDIIILDVYMPGYSGLEVCQRLKEVPETARVPVLLTVGKLEPFKPEEARRVRAEGYIVKPFEASELLSALSKLEDKIVPRPEPSKPGRFARANAAIDESKSEGRYDKAVANEEDSGWKNRIGFPSKDKKTAETAYDDDSTIYNAVNKDLRTVVDRKLAQESREAAIAAQGQNEETREETREEATIDLGAVAPEGLPKDVTPEEIAALAAAAAQVKGKLAESAAPAEANSADTPIPAEAQEAAKKEFAAEVSAKESAATFADQAFAEHKTQRHNEASSDEAAAHKQQSDAAAPSPTEMMAAIAGLIPEMGKTGESSSGNGSGSHEGASYDATSSGAASSSSAAHDSAAHEIEPGLEIEEPRHPYRRATDSPARKAGTVEPATMAAAGGAGFGGSRWTAVAVAVSADEGTVSLEHEMQKAYAAFAAGDAARSRSLGTIPEVEPAPIVNALATAEAVASSQASSQTPALPAPSSSSSSSSPSLSAPLPSFVPLPSSLFLPSSSLSLPSLSGLPVVSSSGLPSRPETDGTGETATPVASTAEGESVRTESQAELQSELRRESAAPAPERETVATAVKEFEKVAASSFGAQAASAEPDAAAVPAVGDAVPSAIEAAPQEQKSEEPIEKREERIGEERKPELQQATVQEQIVPEEMITAERVTGIPMAALMATPAAEEPSGKIEEKAYSSTHEPVKEAAANEAAPHEETSNEATPNGAGPMPSAAEAALASPEYFAAITPAVSSEPAVGGVVVASTPEVAKKESEISETTAAAWASWRRIRESGEPRAAKPAESRATAAEPDAGLVVPDALEKLAGEELTLQELAIKELAVQEKEAVPRPEAARAVAAGAERSPEEVPVESSDSTEIASIVDSMLADLRPKMLEEISRKLGKKK